MEILFGLTKDEIIILIVGILPMISFCVLNCRLVIGGGGGQRGRRRVGGRGGRQGNLCFQFNMKQRKTIFRFITFLCGFYLSKVYVTTLRVTTFAFYVFAHVLGIFVIVGLFIMLHEIIINNFTILRNMKIFLPSPFTTTTTTSSAGSSSSDAAADTIGDETTIVTSMSYHNNKEWLILSFYSGHVSIYKFDEGYGHRFLVTKRYAVRACTFIENENNNNNIDNDCYCIVGSDDGRLRFFSLQGIKMYDIRAHTDSIRSIQVHPTQQNLFLSTSDDMTIKLWDMDTTTKYKNITTIRTFWGHKGGIMQVKININNTNEFATASTDGTIKLWSINGRKSRIEEGPNFTLLGHTDGVNTIDYLQDNNNNNNNTNSNNSNNNNNTSSSIISVRPFLASGSDDKTVKIWNYQTRQLLHTFCSHTENVTAVLFQKNFLVSTSEDCSIRFWNYYTGDSDALHPLLGRGWTIASRRRRKRKSNNSSSSSSITTNPWLSNEKESSSNSNNNNNNLDQIAIGFDRACFVLDLLVQNKSGQNVNGLEIVNEHNIVWSAFENKNKNKNTGEEEEEEEDEEDVPLISV